MIVDVWSWDVALGKGVEAINWLKRGNQIHAGNGRKARILRPSNGSINKVFVQVEFESFTDFDEYWPSFFQSDAWQEMQGEFPDLLVPNSTERYQFNVVE